MKTTRSPNSGAHGKAARRLAFLALAVAMLAGWSVSAATLHVWLGSPNPMPPYDSWGNAATNIQDAVDAAADGDTVLVNNGVYATGGRAVDITTTNRVVVDKAITVESLMGPEVTVIKGVGPRRFDRGIRCVYLGTNAIVSGFTLTNGGAGIGGGAWCESSATLTNCVVTGNSAWTGGGAYGGTLNNCTLANNSAYVGGGASGWESGCTLSNCIVTGNSATFGGGAAESTLYNSTVTYNAVISDLFNEAYGSGGGVYESELYNCTLSGNSTDDSGGGAYGGTLNNCTLSGNSSSWNGGGTCYGTLNNCALSGNSAAYGGGGAFGAMLNNCTLTGNSAGSGGGVYGGTLNNCIVCYNSAPNSPNYDYSAFNYSCTTPLPTNGVGNIDLDPLFVDTNGWSNLRLLSNSPCINAGDDAYVTSATDLDVNPRIVGGTVDMGAYEYQVSQGVWYVNVNNPLPAFPFTSWATAATNIQDAVDGAADGDTVLVTNGVYATGGRAVVGLMTNRVAVDRAVTVQSVNGPEVTVIEGVPGIRCAYLGTNAILSGFTLTHGNAEYGGGAYCAGSATLTNCIVTDNTVTNSGGGVYGGRLYNCTLTGNSGGGACESALTNCIINNNFGRGTLDSTLYNCTLTGNAGGGALNCTLYNCTLTGNTANGDLYFYARGGGGGAYSCTLYNCLLSGNSVSYGDGGGSYGGQLYNCTLTNNRADRGGGTYGGNLVNCTLTGNSGDLGGGACGDGLGLFPHNCYLHNCIVYFNSAPSGPNYSGTSFFYYSCTTPLPTNGVGNIDLDPLFVDTNGWSNLRLQSNSPCINAGNNAYVTSATDLDGNPRIVSGTVDMGAYEFQGSGSIISYAWLQQFGLPTDGSVDATDSDADGHTTFQEWMADTDPTNALSYFHIEAISKSSPAMISFQSSPNRTYTLWGTPQLTPPDWTPVPGVQAIPGNGGTLTLSDPTNAPQQFYRVEVNLP